VVWVAVVVALGTASTVLLLAVVVALIRHIKLLSRALEAFQEQVRPMLNDIRRGSEQAQDRLQGLSQRGLRR
jgi:hypothetical protein